MGLFFVLRGKERIMAKTRIIFQGDSITDGSRDKRNYYDMGLGYPLAATKYLRAAHPDVDFEFINMGISGNRTSQLFDRLYTDTLSLNPDIISILIGVNDIWHRHGSGQIKTSDEQIALNYRRILERIKAESNAKIVMLAPFVLDAENKQMLRDDLVTVRPIVRALADEFADVFIPLDDLFAEALKTQPAPLYYSGDGVHPNAAGADFIGKHYAEAVGKLL